MQKKHQSYKTCVSHVTQLQKKVCEISIPDLP
jgi:hypothetical protein